MICAAGNHGAVDEHGKCHNCGFNIADVRGLSVTLHPDPDIVTAIEYGFRCSEKGWNMDQTLAEYLKLLRWDG